MTQGPDHVQEKVLASSLMMMAAGTSASVIDKFLSWLIAGAGAAVALVVSNPTSFGPTPDHPAIHCAAIVYLVAAGCTVIEKFVASVIIGAAASARQATEFVKDLPPSGNLDMKVVFAEFESATFRPTRWFLTRSFAKVQRGDYTAAAKNFAKWVQLTALLSLVAAGLVFWSLGLVVNGLSG